MTDKQVIYNCPHISFTDWGTYACKLYDPRDKNCLVKGGNCDSNISCPYKQLKLKEQECEELKQEIDIKSCANNELSLEVKKYKKIIDKANDCILTSLKVIEERNKKLRQTLTEIKEIAEKEVNNRMLFANKESFYDFNKILQICDEVNDV